MKRPLVPCAAIVLIATLALIPGAAAASNWTARQLPPAPGMGPWGPSLSGVSCPTDSLCVAVGGRQTLASSRTPTGGAAEWRVVDPSSSGAGNGALTAISCASQDFCVAVSYDGFVYLSTNPAGDADAWTPTSINEGGGHGATHLTAVSCPSPSFCAAVSGGYGQGYPDSKAPGKVLTSTDPTSGRWQVTELGSALDLRGISCGTPSFCVAVARQGRLFISTNPSGGASAWTEVGTPGGPGDLEGVDCLSTLLCATGNLTGNILTSTNPAAVGAAWREVNAGGSVQVTDVTCPSANRCVAVDNNGDVLTSTDPTGGAGSWRFENLIPFEPTEEREGQPPRNALFSASCASTSLCALVGSDGYIFTATDPFEPPSEPPVGRRSRPRPRTILVFAEHFWKNSRGRHVRARFRFYSPTREQGFECKPDRGPYRPCRSPLRYHVAPGRHVLRVRAIGPTGLRGPAAVKRFQVLRPGQVPH